MNATKLKAAMAERNLTIEQAAHELNINPSTLYRKLLRGNSLSVEQASSLARILKLSNAEASDIFLA